MTRPPVALPPLGMVVIVPSDFSHSYTRTASAPMPGAGARRDKKGNPEYPEAMLIPVFATAVAIASPVLVADGVASLARERTTTNAMQTVKAMQPVRGLQRQIAAALRTKLPNLPASGGWVGAEKDSVAAAKASGADTALQLEVLSFELVSMQRYKGGCGLRGVAYARLINLHTGTTICTLNAEFVTPLAEAKSFNAWAEADGKLLKLETDRFVQSIANELARQLSGGAHPRPVHN